MKEAWEKLGDEFAGSRSVVIGDVDCTIEKDLCSQHSITGYPTIKHWKDGHVENYQGPRDYDSLLSHTQTHLARGCNVHDQANTCTDQEKDFIAKVFGISLFLLIFYH